MMEEKNKVLFWLCHDTCLFNIPVTAVKHWENLKVHQKGLDRYTDVSIILRYYVIVKNNEEDIYALIRNDLQLMHSVGTKGKSRTLYGVCYSKWEKRVEGT